MKRKIWLGQARTLIAAIGGIAVASGWTDAATVEIVGGAALTIGAAGWSAYDKIRGK